MSRKALDPDTLAKLDKAIAGTGHAYLPEAIVAELLRGYRRYVAIAQAAADRAAG